MLTKFRCGACNKATEKGDGRRNVKQKSKVEDEDIFLLV
jgi:hypothetical protein